MLMRLVAAASVACGCVFVSTPAEARQDTASYLVFLQQRPIGREDVRITTTAEGVETAEHLALIRAAGCADAQGYYFSEPEPASAIRRWFEPASLDG